MTNTATGQMVSYRSVTGIILTGKVVGIRHATRPGRATTLDIANASGRGVTTILATAVIGGGK